MEKIMNELIQLKKENAELKRKLKELGYIFDDENIQLNKQERLAIFKDYFKGRTDVYAQKYYSKKNNRFEYSFVCENKFKQGVCFIGKKKCHSDCPNFKPAPLTNEIYLKHLQKENSVIGIYPLLEDNTCYFLVIDFDKDLWFESLLCVYRTAKKYSISCLMERSQSGNGGHLWIFFENAIKATKARLLGDFLLKEAMKTNKDISFDSFDRMFPNQDYLSGKGFGNCIALPLQYEPVLQSNSVFINEFQVTIKKPFHFLKSTIKVKESIIDQLIQSHETSFKDYFHDFDTQLSLYEPIQQPITIIENSMLHISKKGLNAKTINTIRRISSTYNPQFYQNLRLHLSVYNVSRVLCENIEDDYDIYLPRGLKEKLLETIDDKLVVYQDQTFEGDSIEVSFKGALRSEQQIAADALLKHNISILEAIPGFGKTVIALYLMSMIQKSTLIIVHSKELLNQWKEKIDEFIEYPKAKLKRDHYIGEYYSNKKKLKYHIDIALIQSLSKIDNMKTIQKYGLVLIDECHHASSDTYRTVLRNINAKYIYSFSGTPERKDKLEKVIQMYLGNIVYKVDKQEMIKSRNYEQILIPRMTTFKIIDQDLSFHEIANKLYQNQKRNHLIIQDVVKKLKENKNIIILTDRKEHIQILYKELEYYDYDIYCMSGDNSVKERKTIKKQIEQSQHYIIIATSQLLGEGFDLPSLNTMFITMPISFKGRLSQYVGRLHRDYENQELVEVYDYADIHVKVLQNMFQKRLKTYKNEGYNVVENEEIIQFDQAIFDKANYEYYLHSSMNHAIDNIIIFVNDCKLYRIQRLYSFLISLLAKGIKIYICINKNYDQDILAYLEGICTKILHTESYINAIMIDERELWSSSSSYLGVQSHDLFYIKSNDNVIIEELKMNINS